MLQARCSVLEEENQELATQLETYRTMEVSFEA